MDITLSRKSLRGRALSERYGDPDPNFEITLLDFALNFVSWLFYNTVYYLVWSPATGFAWLLGGMFAMRPYRVGAVMLVGFRPHKNWPKVLGLRIIPALIIFPLFSAILFFFGASYLMVAAQFLYWDLFFISWIWLPPIIYLYIETALSVFIGIVLFLELASRGVNFIFYGWDKTVAIAQYYWRIKVTLVD